MEAVPDYIIDVENVTYTVRADLNTILQDIITVYCAYTAYPVDAKVMPQPEIERLVRNAAHDQMSWLRAVLKQAVPPEAKAVTAATFAPVLENAKVLRALNDSVRDLLVTLGLSDFTCDNWGAKVLNDLASAHGDNHLQTKHSGYARRYAVLPFEYKPSFDQLLALPGVESGVISVLIKTLISLDSHRFDDTLFSLREVISTDREATSRDALINLIDDMRAFCILYLVSAMRIWAAMPLAILKHIMADVRTRRNISKEAVSTLDESLAAWYALPAHPLALIVEDAFESLTGKGRFGSGRLLLMWDDAPANLADAACRSLELVGVLTRNLEACGGTWGIWDSKSSAADSPDKYIRATNYAAGPVVSSNVIYFTDCLAREPRLATAMSKIAGTLGWSKPSKLSPFELPLAEAPFIRSDGLKYSLEPWPAMMGLIPVLSTGEATAGRMKPTTVDDFHGMRTEIYTAFLSAEYAATKELSVIERDVIPISMAARETGLEHVAVTTTALGTHPKIIAAYYSALAPGYILDRYENRFSDASIDDASAVTHGWGVEIEARNKASAARALAASLGEAAVSAIGPAERMLYYTREGGLLRRQPIKRSVRSFSYDIYDERSRIMERQVGFGTAVNFNNNLSVSVDDGQFKAAISALMPGRRSR